MKIYYGCITAFVSLLVFLAVTEFSAAEITDFEQRGPRNTIHEATGPGETEDARELGLRPGRQQRGNRRGVGAKPVLWLESEGGNGHWYAVLPGKLTWEKALDRASAREHYSLPGYLATITSPEENLFILEQVLPSSYPRGNRNRFWLGGIVDECLKWSWITDEQLSYENWGVGEPDYFGWETPISMWGYDTDRGVAGQWSNDRTCYWCDPPTRYASIIEWGKPDAGGDTGPNIINLIQWPQEHGGNDHWYAALADAMYWEDARDLVATIEHEGLPGHLASVTSVEENDFIFTQVISGTDQHSILDEFWLGGEDRNGQWIWITGEPFTFVNWSTNEPNNVGIETALCMWGPNTTHPWRIPGKWNNSLPNADVNCLHRYWALIEWESAPGSASGPSDENQLVLAQNFPNPFNPATQIRFTLPQDSPVSLEIYDILGRRVRTLVDRKVEAGEHVLVWDGTGTDGKQAASGIYLYRIEAGEFVQAKKMIKLK